jgi:hypothetical protein
MGRKAKEGTLSIDELARRYRAGEAYRPIAAATGLSRSTVWERLRPAAVEMRPARKPPG